MRSLAAVVTLCALVRLAAAAPPKPVAVTGALPAGVKPSGSLDAAWAFGDKRGINYVLFSSKALRGGPGPEGDPTAGAMLYVDHWIVPAGGKAKLVRTVRDKVEDCAFSMTAKFHDDAFGVTDLDGDGTGEITFAYETGCRSDVSSDTLKLLVLENGAKYILRGETRIEGATGGSFTADPAEARWPAKFLAHAKDVWDATADDASIPPGVAGANPCGN